MSWKLRLASRALSSPRARSESLLQADEIKRLYDVLHYTGSASIGRASANARL